MALEEGASLALGQDLCPHVHGHGHVTWTTTTLGVHHPLSLPETLSRTPTVLPNRRHGSSNWRLPRVLWLPTNRWLVLLMLMAAEQLLLVSAMIHCRLPPCHVLASPPALTSTPQANCPAELWFPLAPLV